MVETVTTVGRPSPSLSRDRDSESPRLRQRVGGKYPPAKPGAYMRLRKSRVFFRGIFYRTIAFVKDVVRAVEQREAFVCIHGMIALFAWPRRAVNPRSPQGRAVGARG
jgi:hypothetical protein